MAGETYRVSAWLRRSEIGGSSSSSGARVTVRWYNSSDSQLSEDTVCSNLQGTADWTECTRSFVTPLETAKARVFLRLYNSTGTVHFDDVSLQFTAPDTIGPSISGISVSGITDTQATIAWTTNEDANSQVEYGPSIAYGLSTALDSALVTGHSQNLTGLSASTLYHYQVCSADAAGNRTCSEDQTLNTLAPPTVGTNLVSNTGFESGTSGWSFCSSSYCSIDSAIYRSGTYAAKITRTSRGISEIYTNPRISGVTAGQNYRITAWLRLEAVVDSSSSSGARVVVRWYDSLSSQIGGDVTVCSGIQGTVDWTECSNLFIAPASATQMRVFLRLYNATGSVWFDDVSANQVTY
ncbi:MAG: fibronectin type III domain-containing protein [Deltaproteobacteria bacterium]|nr:fibronectin type III domain-containing protein [Deltaproteobacteria bacterium]